VYDGALAAWLPNGATVTGDSYLSWQYAGTDWQIVSR
jgi:hypothetical protein